MRPFLAASLALASLFSPWTLVDAVKACTECPQGQTCLLEDAAYKIPAGQSKLQLKVCNFDASKAGEYAITFGLRVPLNCDPNASLLPAVKSLTAQGACAANSAEPCVVVADLEDPLDWALAMQTESGPNVLQAKITNPAGPQDMVQIAIGEGIGGAALTPGNATTVSVCTNSFSVSGTHLSTLSSCNVGQLCRGKAADTACTTQVLSAQNISDVACTNDQCTGKLQLSEALPCDIASGDTNTLLFSVAVAKSAASNFVSLATVTGATAATITKVSGVAVDKDELLIYSDAMCLEGALEVNVSGQSLTDISVVNGSIDVSLSSNLASTLAGTSLDITVSQCGVSSEPFSVTVTEAGEEDDASSSSTGTGKTVQDPNGTSSTQQENASTGLPGGMYIAIGVGALALCGFLFECWYHRRRHREEFKGNAPVTRDNGGRMSI